MKALVLAAGLGMRMRPLTEELPKCLLPIGGKPLVTHILELLGRHGLRDVYINLYWHSDAIRRALADGADIGVRINYLAEEELSGTAGPIPKLSTELSGDRFLVLNGDNLTNLDLTALVEFHRQTGAELTIALHREASSDLPEKSVVETDNEGRITKFVEKPAVSELFSEWASGGVYVFEPSLIQSIPDTRPYDLGHDLIPALLRDARRVFGFKAEFYLVDIGTPEAYARAEEDLIAGRVA